MLRKVLGGVLAAIAITAAGSVQAGTFGLTGNTFDNGTSFDLTSKYTPSAPYDVSGIVYTADAGLTLAGITQLFADYNMLSGGFNGGSPRFGIADSTGHQVWVYWGTPLGGGSFQNPNANDVWGNTGNFAGASTVSFYSNNFGGFNSPNTGVDWNTLVANAGSTIVSKIYLDLDSGWADPNQQGQHLLINNFTVNNDLLAVPGPIAGAGLPGLIAACGGLLALARRLRRKIV